MEQQHQNIDWNAERLRGQQARIQETPDVSGRDDAYFRMNQPYYWAVHLNASIADYVSTYDYTVGRHEREAIAYDIVNTWVEQNAVEAHLAYEGLNHWFRIYGRGVQG